MAQRHLHRLIRTPTTRALSTHRPSDTASASASDTTHFGNRTIPLADKQSKVSQVFNSVAPSYDLMNDLMSAGVHRLWKSAFVAQLAPTADMSVLDCAGGTADIAARILHLAPNASVTVADINDDMLAVGRERARNDSLPLRFVNANAENLPFQHRSFDAYTISFGMRNVPRPQLALQEAFRVLRPGGRFMMLEFAKVTNPQIAALYEHYSFRVIPALGRAVADDEDSYRYLVESIRQFPAQQRFLQMVSDAGFIRASVTDYSFGIAACYSAFKPVR